MSDILCIVGASGSGKTTIANELCASYPHLFRVRPMYTTREPRSTQDHYSFLCLEQFRQISDSLGKSFISENYYGRHYGYDITVDQTHVWILTPWVSALNDILDSIPHRVVSVLLDADKQTLRDRMIQGGDNHESIERRMETWELFQCVSNRRSCILNAHLSVKDLAQKIHSFYSK